MPALIRLYVRNVVIGFALSAVFVALLLWFNVANLWHLVAATEGGWLAVAMLFMFNGIVFAGVQFGLAVMRMADKDGGPRKGLREPVARHAAPAPVIAAARPRH